MSTKAAARALADKSGKKSHARSARIRSSAIRCRVELSIIGELFRARIRKFGWDRSVRLAAGTATRASQKNASRRLNADCADSARLRFQ